jgi:hypothetical protein
MGGKSLVTTLAGGNYLAHAVEKQRIANQIRVRGTPSRPQPPRDIQIQPAAGGVYVSWKLPPKHDNVAGWRIYVNTESNLAAQIRDKGTRQQFIPLSSGTTPATANIMVSSFSTLGRESAKVIQQGAPLAASPTYVPTSTIPSSPPGYTEESAGGLNRSLVRFNGEKQYVNSQ